MDLLDIVVRGALVGIGGAALMDVWSLLLRRSFGIRGLDYGLLGRWIGHMPRGRFVHERIGAAAVVPFERPLGWAAHYGIGITFAYLLIAIWGAGWLATPSLGPALVIGLGTIVAPWFVMQPGMGLGIAASRTPNPGAARVRNLATHAVYGLGLYATALVLALASGTAP
jgi:hypothetical protein